jgi:hypothetical protein
MKYIPFVRFTGFSTLVQFLVPFVIITVCYSNIFTYLKVFIIIIFTLGSIPGRNMSVLGPLVLDGDDLGQVSL